MHHRIPIRTRQAYTRRLLAIFLVLAPIAVLPACAGSLARTPAHARAEVEPLSGSQLLELADVLARSGDSLRAQQYLLLAQKQGASERDVLPRLLQLYVADGQYRLAIEHAESFLRRHPGDTRARQLLASLYAGIGFVSDAARHYEGIVQREPKNAHAHYALAALLDEAGAQRARADEHYRLYLALEPAGEHAEEARAGLLEAVP